MTHGPHGTADVGDTGDGTDDGRGSCSACHLGDGGAGEPAADRAQIGHVTKNVVPEVARR